MWTSEHRENKDTTTVSASAGYSLAPGDVSPGHMMLAPLKTNLMAPLSTCWCGRIKGSVKKRIYLYIIIRSKEIKQFHQHIGTHIYATIWGWGKMVLLSVWKTAALHLQSGFQCVHGWLENKWKQLITKTNPMEQTTNVQNASYHLTILTGSFFGIMWLSHASMSGNWSNSWFLIPFITDVFNWIQLDTFSFSSNLKWVAFN